MCVQPTTLAPASGFSPPALFLRFIRAGISKYHRWESRHKNQDSLRSSSSENLYRASLDGFILLLYYSFCIKCGLKTVCIGVPRPAISISLRPKSAWLMFLMQKSDGPLVDFWSLSLGEDSSSEVSLCTATHNLDYVREIIWLTHEGVLQKHMILWLRFSSLYLFDS